MAGGRGFQGADQPVLMTDLKNIFCEDWLRRGIYNLREALDVALRLLQLVFDVFVIK